MKKVLFTIQWYPSVLSANALCDENIIHALFKTGNYDISCLVYSTPDFATYEEIEGIKVYRFRKGYLWDMVINAKQNPSYKKSKIILKVNRIIQRIKQIILIPWYPIIEPITILKFAKKAIKLHKTENFDYVISEHNGMDSLLAGYYLKRKYPNIKYVPIFWDPLYGKETAKYLPDSYSKKRQKKLEKKILYYADQAIFMENMKKFHKDNDISYTDKCVYMSFPKLIRRTGFKNHEDYTKEGKINIVFSGILNLPDRDPSYFLKVVSNSSYADDINLLFFCTGSGRNLVEQFKTTYQGDVVISSYIPVSTLSSVYNNSDILLNIGGPNPNMIPSKIYDYMSSCKPIISTYYIDNDASKSILSKYPAILFLDLRESLDTNVSHFDEFIQNINSIKVDFQDIESRFSMNSPKHYVELFDKMEINE